MINSIFAPVLLLVLRLARAAAGGGGDEAFFPDERNDLIRLRDTLASAEYLHSNWTGPPCFGNRSRWVGITCTNNHVVGVALERVQLTGELPPTAFQNVTYLTELNLRGNALRGGLPGLGGLRRLRAVLLSSNRFSGPIPAGLAGLPVLTRLELQDNLLDGAIPPFEQPELAVFNVSYNFLEGPVPDTATLRGFPASSFDHNLKLCGEPLDRSCPVVPTPSRGSAGPPPPPSHEAPKSSIPSPADLKSKRVKPSTVVLIAVAAALGVPLVLLLCFLCYYERRTAVKKVEQGKSGETSAETAANEMRTTETTEGREMTAELEFFHKDAPVFNLDELLNSSTEVLGRGNLGTTYKVTMQSGPVFVVKRLKDMGGLPKNDLVHHMRLLGKTRHENLVEVLSLCCFKEERLLVSEYVPGGSLFDLLHGNRGEGGVALGWEARLDILKGVARGLAHLHHHNIPHGNLKATNIIVHGDGHSGYRPKLIDFGFLPLLPGSSSLGKLAAGETPEFFQGKELTHKSDVYCFGLILIEVITGRMWSNKAGVDLVEWVNLGVKVDWPTDVTHVEWLVENKGHREVMKLAGIAMECACEDLRPRPEMEEILRRVEDIVEAADGEQAA